MAMSQAGVITAVQTILAGARADEAPRLKRIHDAMQPCGPNDRPRVSVPRGEEEITLMTTLARKADTNVLPLVLDTFGQVMKLDGYYTAGLSAEPWRHFQRNGFDARQTGLHRSALQFGAAYLTVLPGGIPNRQPDPGAPADNTPVARGVSPRAMTALYQDPSDDDWPMLALHVDGALMKLYDETSIYYVGIQNLPRSGLSSLTSLTGLDFHYIEGRTHDVGVCPVIRFRDRMLLEGEEQLGIIEPLLTIQERINETTFGMLVAQYFAAFKQRYVIGWMPQSEQELLKASASQLWTFEDGPDMVKVGELTETDMTRYIESKGSAFRDMAAIAQVPAQNLGIDGVSNISAETLAGLEAGKERKADEITTSFGESWEQYFRLSAHIAGDVASSRDFSAEVRWRDATARSFAQTVDGLGKLATMLQIPPELLWEDIPGWTDTKVQRATALARRQAARASVTALSAAAEAARADPTVADLAGRRGVEPEAPGAAPVGA